MGKTAVPTSEGRDITTANRIGIENASTFGAKQTSSRLPILARLRLRADAISSCQFKVILAGDPYLVSDSDNMSSPPSTDRTGASPRVNPPSHQPLFISYVTGTRPGTGHWTTRVSRQVGDTAAVHRASSGNHPEAANSVTGARTNVGEGSETVQVDQEQRRITLPLPLAPPVTMSSRYSARESSAVDKAPSRPEKTLPHVSREESAPESSETTLRHLWQRAGTPSKVGDGRLTEEQIFKGLVVDYLSHERFPNTVGVLLGARTADQENGKGKARESEGQADDDVYMMSASSTLGRSEGHQIERNGKLDPKAFVKQIERRRGEFDSIKDDKGS